MPAIFVSRLWDNASHLQVPRQGTNGEHLLGLKHGMNTRSSSSYSESVKDGSASDTVGVTGRDLLLGWTIIRTALAVTPIVSALWSQGLRGEQIYLVQVHNLFFYCYDR